jgi:ABC-2 type transport system ATP-binding protein
MKRRLNIACALVHDPDILLFDEPTVGVDPQSRNAIFDNLEALRDRGKALLYTTHYMEEAERLCDTVVVMDQGRVVAQGDQATLLGTLPAAQALTLTLAAHSPPPRLDALQALPGVRAVTLAQQTLSVALASPQALTAASAAVLAALDAQGCAVSQLATRRATLEDVFLALTGRQLRDE